MHRLLFLTLFVLLFTQAALSAEADDVADTALQQSDTKPDHAIADDAADTALQHSVNQLRHAVGAWDVQTQFLNTDGSVARSVPGIYTFEWVIADRVVSGRSELPALEQTSALLFYIDEKDQELEMVSVSTDGKLWIMSGPLGGETRTTEPFATSDGGDACLRFTRYNVSAGRFESKMEYSSDGGETWLPGNHQVFKRVKTPADG